MALNTQLGWTEGDEVRVLIAAGLTVGVYQVTQLQADMNYLGLRIPGLVLSVLDLLDAYDTIQDQLTTLNNEAGGKVLVKADVLEWAVKSPGETYSPERELQRIRDLLAQYFASSPLFTNTGFSGTTPLYRS